MGLPPTELLFSGLKSCAFLSRYWNNKHLFNVFIWGGCYLVVRLSTGTVLCAAGHARNRSRSLDRIHKASVGAMRQLFVEAHGAPLRASRLRDLVVGAGGVPRQPGILDRTDQHATSIIVIIIATVIMKDTRGNSRRTNKHKKRPLYYFTIGNRLWAMQQNRLNTFDFLLFASCIYPDLGVISSVTTHCCCVSHHIKPKPTQRTPLNGRDQETVNNSIP